MDNAERLAAFKAAAIWPFDLWGYETWERYNAAYFDGSLQAGQIFWGITAYGRCIGLHQGRRNVIVLHQSLLDMPDGGYWQPGDSSGRELAAGDVLLHEMVHQTIHQRLGHSGCGHNAKRGRCTSHNNEHWVAEVNRIAPLLELSENAAVIKQKRIKEPGGKGPGSVIWHVPAEMMTRKQLSAWPHSARPKGYYRSVPVELANQLG